MILLTDDTMEPFDFIKESIPSWSKLPLYHLHDTDKIISFFKAQMKKAEPLLNGLVLTGGKSTRMGFDKSLIDWHGKEQGYYMADLLEHFCKEVFVSCRPEQQNKIHPDYLSLTDRFTGLGPYGAILSAFLENPDCAWLVTACDLPLLDKATLQYLTENRNCSAVATTFESPYDGFPEPLVTIWEPKSYPALLFFLSQGYSCPAKALRNNDVKILQPIDPDTLINVNTPQEAEKVRNLLNRKIAG
jgi:molybdopterin-guanine dinucleotide biosynthesis protein A